MVKLSAQSLTIVAAMFLIPEGGDVFDLVTPLKLYIKLKPHPMPIDKCLTQLSTRLLTSQ